MCRILGDQRLRCAQAVYFARWGVVPTELFHGQLPVARLDLPAGCPLPHPFGKVPLLSVKVKEKLPSTALVPSTPAAVALAGKAPPLKVPPASLALTVLSVWVPYERFWIDTTVARGVPAARAHAVIYKQEWDSYWAIRGSQIWGNARLLDHAVPFPLARFRGGPTPGGVAALVVAAAAMGLAVISSADDRSQSSLS